MISAGRSPERWRKSSSFAASNYDVTFEVFAKLHCIGENKHPLYRWLTEQAEPREEVQWNFEKFLITPDGRLAQRFKSGVNPRDSVLIEAVERSLPQ